MTEKNELAGLEIGNDQAYAKVGLYGQQGSGKTFTAALFAIGLHEHIHSKKPVFFFDTETGSSFVKPIFDQAKIPLVGKRSKSFADLMESAEIAERNCDIMICDSMTHVWVDLCDSYRKKKYVCEKCSGSGMSNNSNCSKCGGSGCYRDRLSVWDYAPIKKSWAEWVDFFVNSKLHFFACGRAGGVYELRENPEGKEEIMKVEDKFKSEAEYGYEMSLLIQMKPVKTTKGIDNTAFIWKDRFNVINGLELKMPKFSDILPHIQLLNIGGIHIGTVPGKDTLQMLKTPRPSSEEWQKQKQIVLEEIQALLLEKYPSSSVDDKKGKATAVKSVFNTRSWTAVEGLTLEELSGGFKAMEKLLNQPVSTDNNKGAPPVAAKAVKK